MEKNIEYIENEREKVFVYKVSNQITVNLVKIETASVGRNSRMGKENL